jgi:hypothetical protein
MVCLRCPVLMPEVSANDGVDRFDGCYESPVLGTWTLVSLLSIVVSASTSQQCLSVTY